MKKFVEYISEAKSSGSGPFCGSKEYKVKQQQYVECDKCHARGPTSTSEDLQRRDHVDAKNALERWMERK